MRCKKCGYISFDQMETCGGCKKNIAKDAKELSGVVFKSESPDFLWFKRKEDEEPEEEAAEEENSAAEESDDVNFSLGAADEGGTADFSTETGEDGLDIAADEPQEIAFDLSADNDAGEMADQEDPKEEIAFELPVMQDKSAEAAALNLDIIAGQSDDLELPLETSSADGGLDLGLDFDLGDSATAPPLVEPEKPVKAAAGKSSAKAKPAEKASPLDLDLGGLDLDGLASSATAEPKIDFSFSGLGELALEGAAPVKEEGKPGKKKGTSSGKSATDTLPDLAMEGLDLDAPTLPPAASAAGKKLRPAAKTGTALDAFDIDLGDLLGGGKK